MARWLDGSMARWLDGSMARWLDGSMARWQIKADLAPRQAGDFAEVVGLNLTLTAELKWVPADRTASPLNTGHCHPLAESRSVRTLNAMRRDGFSPAKAGIRRFTISLEEVPPIKLVGNLLTTQSRLMQNQTMLGIKTTVADPRKNGVITRISERHSEQIEQHFVAIRSSPSPANNTECGASAPNTVTTLSSASNPRSTCIGGNGLFSSSSARQ